MQELASKVSAVKERFSTAAVVNTLFKTILMKNANGSISYCGNDTECALLIMAGELGHKYEEIRVTYPEGQAGRKGFSFSSDRKRMSTIVKVSGKDMLFCKGAAEIVSGICTKYYKNDGTIGDIDASMRKQLEQTISDYADEGLRTLCIAERDVSGLAEKDLTELEKDLVLIGLVGIEDPLRAEVPGAIQDCQSAGIVVRMVTGDNIQTARAIAKKCGIITEADGEGSVMDGKTFRERVTDKNGEIIQDEFDKVWPNLRVLARSTPLDKFVLVSGIQQSEIGVKQTVAVTGDGTNDAPALKQADVGFAMGIQGTDVAKNASDVIIMDDNFVSIVAAVKWGRCVYDNICKFLQFQLTVNITACSLACVGAAILTESPLNAIQMLWVNLIMDSFASLALATEDPTGELLKRKPYPRDQAVLSQTMVRNMILHSSWQLIVLSFIIFGMGDVCRGNGQTCEGEIFVDNFGKLRSGRPTAYDWNGVPGLFLSLPLLSFPLPLFHALLGILFVIALAMVACIARQE
jgi:Ca2+ transporting ATPase